MLLWLVTAVGYFNVLADWVVAFGTVLLAIATFTSIFALREHEKSSMEAAIDREERYRVEQREREERDRKGLLLGELYNWASIINTKCSEFRIYMLKTKNSDIEADKLLAFSSDNLRLELTNAVYFIKIAEGLSDSLKQKVTNLNKELISLISSFVNTNEWCNDNVDDNGNFKGENKSELTPLLNDIWEKEDILKKTINDLFTEIAKTKIELL